jgi:hypothetical protein
VTKSENVMGISSWIKGFLVVFFSFFCDHAVASATMLLPAGRGPTYTGRIRRYESAFFSSHVFFPSPHALVGWVRGMIFSLILLASRPQQ